MEQIFVLIARLRGQIRDEDGAVTVDWIVLTAVTVMLGMAAAFTVGANIPGLANQLSKTVENTDMDG
ncbi:hypothetical protein [Aliiroseovarius lamellibrachiae]|uniref:hypothetical protein n=1 Tax=Aliiroseovarius lamellibrachiae TaxID=1924933 RepID=UPI001BE09266|nr:hypothetical protein [Aliiroseovarius lamellibrachiae]MBT2130044.1 hypothetical protein [Aliiroseovarius lamellibrachiae]